MPISNALIQSAPQNKLMDAQMLRPTGEGSYLRQQFPQVYGFLGGLAGTAPDEMAGSVLDPNTAAVRQAAAYSYLPGLVASSAPLGKAGAGLGMLAGMTKGAGKAEEALAAGKGAQQFNNSALTNTSPLVVYRGGIKGSPIKTEGLEPGSVQLGQGAYFGPKSVAEEFAQYRPNGIVEEFHLNLKNPFDETRGINPLSDQMKTLRNNLLEIGVPKSYVDELDQPYRGAVTNLADALSKKLTRQNNPTTNWEAADKINAAIRKSGFDGIIADWNGSEQYVAFSPKQFNSVKQFDNSALMK
jgi:hypothetical protein